MKRELRIGIFLVAAFLIMAVLIVIVEDVTVLFKKVGYPLYVNFDSAAGLEKRTAVKMAGVAVGYVKDIQLVKRKARVTMNIYSGIEIPKDSQATFATLGLLGEKYIEILPGTETAICPPGETIGGLPSGGIDQLGTQLVSLSEQLREAGDTFKDIMGEKTRENFKDAIQNLSSLTAGLNEILGANRETINQTVRRASGAFQNFDQRVEEISKNLNQSLLLIKEMASENKENVKKNIEKIKELITEIEKSVKLLNESLEKINRGEGTLGKLIQDPDLYQKTEGTLEEMQKTFRPLSSLQASVDLRADYYGESDLLKAGLSLALWLTPKKYFLAQVIRDPWLGQLTFSAQAGRRLGNFVPRAGLLESELGIGLDYLALEDRWVVSLESFDFNREGQPHFRLSSQFSLHKNFYFILGIDDFTLASKREVFFGLGFR